MDSDDRIWGEVGRNPVSSRELPGEVNIRQSMQLRSFKKLTLKI